MDSNKNINFNLSSGIILRGILLLVLVFLLYYLRDLILVILTAVVLASFIDAVVKKVNKYKVNRVLFVIFIYLLIFSSLAFLFYFLAPIVFEEVNNLLPVVADYLPQSGIWQTFNLEKIVNTRDIVPVLSQQLGDSLSQDFIKQASSVFGGFLNLILIVIISFYLSIQEKGIEKFLQIIIPLKHEDYIIGLWQRTQRKIALWIRGQFLLGLMVGILIYLGLSILGIKYAFILALTATIFELIPFGIILAAVPAVALAYTGGGISSALMVGGLYTIIHQFEVYLFQPLVIKKVIGISPLVVILSVLVGVRLAGVWGLILAIPVAVAILEFVEDLEQKKVSARSNKE